MLSDPQANAQLAATVDAGKPMVESTYILEGDETLTWKCYEQLLYIQNSINTAYFPNVTAISRELSGGQPPLAQQWYQAGLAAIQPGWDYFQQTIQGNMQPEVQIFKAARLFDPRKSYVLLCMRSILWHQSTS